MAWRLLLNHLFGPTNMRPSPSRLLNILVPVKRAIDYTVYVSPPPFPPPPKGLELAGAAFPLCR
jgi:hypothetical protein